MIYTVTFNLALDYVVKVDNFTTGTVNRTVSEEIFYGGKGINVSAVLKELGYASTALGFVAGFTGDEIERGVRTLGFASDFIRVKDGMSRINVKMKSDNETEINGIGPQITESDVEKLFEKLEKLENGDILVLSGSIPKSIDDRIYETIMSRLDGKGIRIVVDATKDLLLNVLKYHPFLIKPNIHELSELCGAAIRTKDELAACVRSLQKAGVRNVLVSMGRDGACLFTEPGEVLYAAGISGKAGNTVGAGDSMVAGFLAGYLTGGSYREALRTGAAAGTATAFSFGIAGEEEITGCMEQVVIEELKI